jgi:CO dehydrogenase maturation factor
MKVLICGKGGCGKSTITAMLAKYLSNNGYRVLVVDIDESNPGLYRMLGLQKTKTLAEHLGGKKSVKSAINRDLSLPKSIDEIPKEVISAKGNLGVISIGKIEDAGEGCACPYAVLARRFIKGLELKDGEVVLIDAEAGIEHFGRGIDLEVEVIVNVAEPSIESLELSKKIKELAEKSRLKHVLLLNKALPDILEKIAINPDIVIPFDQTLIYGSLEGKEVDVFPQIEELWQKIKS